MLTVDDRCTIGGHGSDPIYRMVGSCGNCRVSPVLILQTSGHMSYTFRCPVCGCKEVRPQRLANDEEIPAA